LRPLHKGNKKKQRYTVTFLVNAMLIHYKSFQWSFI